ncbi:hypothetical protein HDU96_005944 [Phlyctochytrium bullatum]|nr:hypothetical protein HDU96_005944 [Phlyctochytrium bullatum]
MSTSTTTAYTQWLILPSLGRLPSILTGIHDTALDCISLCQARIVAGLKYLPPLPALPAAPLPSKEWTLTLPREISVAWDTFILAPFASLRARIARYQTYIAAWIPLPIRTLSDWMHKATSSLRRLPPPPAPNPDKPTATDDVTEITLSITTTGLTVSSDAGSPSKSPRRHTPRRDSKLLFQLMPTIAEELCERDFVDLSDPEPWLGAVGDVMSDVMSTAEAVVDSDSDFQVSDLLFELDEWGTDDRGIADEVSMESAAVELSEILPEVAVANVLDVAVDALNEPELRIDALAKNMLEAAVHELAATAPELIAPEPLIENAIKFADKLPTIMNEPEAAAEALSEVFDATAQQLSAMEPQLVAPHPFVDTAIRFAEQFPATINEPDVAADVLSEALEAAVQQLVETLPELTVQEPVVENVRIALEEEWAVRGPEVEAMAENMLAAAVQELAENGLELPVMVQEPAMEEAVSMDEVPMGESDVAAKMLEVDAQEVLENEREIQAVTKVVLQVEPPETVTAQTAEAIQTPTQAGQDEGDFEPWIVNDEPTSVFTTTTTAEPSETDEQQTFINFDFGTLALKEFTLDISSPVASETVPQQGLKCESPVSMPAELQKAESGSHSGSAGGESSSTKHELAESHKETPEPQHEKPEYALPASLDKAQASRPCELKRRATLDRYFNEEPIPPTDALSDTCLSTSTALGSTPSPSNKSPSVLSLCDKVVQQQRLSDVNLLYSMLGHWDALLDHVDEAGTRPTIRPRPRFSLDDLAWTHAGTTFAFDENCSHALVEIILAGERGLFDRVPECVQFFPDLRYLDLSGCRLEGEFPAFVAGMEHLEVLILEGNKMVGELPSDLDRLSRLRYLDVSSNMITGAIPQSIGNLKRLQYLNLRKNELSGPIADTLGNLQALRSLDLSQNKLSDEIPPSLGNLKCAREINLSSNALTGSIPKELGEGMEYLTLLDLSANYLTGRVPPELVHLECLKVTGNKIRNAFAVRLRRALSTSHHPAPLAEGKASTLPRNGWRKSAMVGDGM